jgi:hypothetical protein
MKRLVREVMVVQGGQDEVQVMAVPEVKVQEMDQ